MAGVGQLICRSLFGVKGDVKSNVLAPEEEVVVYPSGGYLVRYSSRTKTQEAIVPLTGSGGVPGSSHDNASGSSGGALVLALSPSRRFIAVAERSTNANERVTLSMYASRTLVKKRAITVGSGLDVCGDVRALSFSHDDSMLAVLGAGPAFMVGVYSLESGRLLAALSLRDALSTPLVEGVEGSALMAHAAAKAGVHAGSALSAEVASSLALDVAGLSFSPSAPGTLLAWGAGVLTTLRLSEAMTGTGFTQLAVVPPSPSMEAYVERLATAAAAEGSAASSAASGRMAAAVKLDKVTAAAAAAEADAANAANDAAEATAGLGADESPNDNAMWVMATQQAGSTREAAKIATEAARKAIEMVEAEGMGAWAEAAASVLGVSLRFTAAGWIPAPAATLPSREPDGELALAVTRKGEMLVLAGGSAASPGTLLGCVEEEAGVPPSEMAVHAVAGYSRGDGGFVTAGDGGVIRIYGRVRPDAPPRVHADGSARPPSAGMAAPDGGLLAAAGLRFCVSKALVASQPGVDGLDTIRALCATPSGDRAMFSLSDTQLMSLDIANGPLKEGSSAVTPLGPASHMPEVAMTVAAGGPPSPLSGTRHARAQSAAPTPAAPAPTPVASPSTCAIVSLDVAVRRPLVASAGSDNGVRVWNFVDRLCESSRVFTDPPTALALHPSGLQIIVGFADRLRQFDLVGEELRDSAEWPVRGVTEVRFSRGGALFAAASSSGHTIALYDALTGAYLLSMRGHSGRITGLSWAYNDATLLSCGADGAVYEWSVADGKRTREVLLKGSRFTGVAASKDGSTVYAVGEAVVGNGVEGAGSTLTRMNASGVLAKEAVSYVLRELNMNSGTVMTEYPLPERPAGVALTTSTPRLLFTAAGGSMGDGTVGIVRSLALPLTSASAAASAAAAEAAAAKAAAVPEQGKGGKGRRGSSDGKAAPGAVVAPPPVPTFGSAFLPDMPAGSVTPGTSLGVSKLQLSHDDAWLFVAGMDGMVVAYEVRDGAGKAPVPDGGARMPWLDAATLHLADMAERAAILNEARDRVLELAASSEYAARVRDVEFGEAAGRLTDAASSERDAEAEHYERLAAEKAEGEAELALRVSALEAAHRSEVQKREAMYQGKIMAEVERYGLLVSEVESTRAHVIEARRRAEEHEHEEAAHLTEESESMLEGMRNRKVRLEEDVAGARRDWSETLAQMEGDADAEIQGLKASYQGKLDAERDAALKFKGENGIMRKKFATMGKEIEDNKETIAATLTRHGGLRTVIDGLDRDIATLRGIIHEKDGVISEREKRIYELKKKNQELEKFKFVLDVKIKDLKGQIEPREAEVAALKRQVREVNAELEAYHTSNSSLDGSIGGLRTDIDSLTARAVSGRAQLTRKSAAVRDFTGDLYEAVQAAKTPEDYKAGLDALVAAYVPKAMVAPVVDLSVVVESGRQREQLAATLSGLKSQSDATAAHHGKRTAALVAENTMLIDSTRSLRNEIKRLREETRSHRLDAAQRVSQTGMAALSSASSVGKLRSTVAAAQPAAALLPPRSPVNFDP